MEGLSRNFVKEFYQAVLRQVLDGGVAVRGRLLGVGGRGVWVHRRAAEDLLLQADSSHRNRSLLFRL